MLESQLDKLFQQFNRQMKKSLTDYHFKNELISKIQETILDNINIEKIIKDNLKELK